MPRNTMTILREYNEQHFSKIYKTTIYEYKAPTHSWRIFPRYEVTVHIGVGKLKMGYYRGDKQEQFHISVEDTTQEKQCRYLVRYFNKTNDYITEYLEKVREILYVMPHSGDDIKVLITLLIDNLPWM